MPNIASNIKRQQRPCETNPRVTVETVMNSPRLNVWCALSKNRLIKLFFFEDDIINGGNATIILYARSKEVEVCSKWSTLSHFASNVRRFLDEHFPKQWIETVGPTK